MSTPGAPGTSRPGQILFAAAIVQFMISMDLSVVNVGLPAISTGLSLHGADTTWVIHAYALTFGGLLLLGGALGDRWGHRRLLLGGLVLFALASLAGGLAQTGMQLIAARALQGIGAAALAPAALALLTRTFPSGAARSRAFAIWAGANAAGGALGILIGGTLTELTGWRSVMLVNVPMALIVLATAARSLPAAAAASQLPRPDVPGAVLVTAGMTLGVFGIVRTDHFGWTAPGTVLTLALAAVLLTAFVIVEARSDHPLVRPAMLRRRSVAGANLVNLLIGAAMASAFYVLSLFLQQVLGHGPAATGSMFLPFTLALILAAALAGKLSTRWGPRTFLAAGTLTTGIGMLALTRISADGSFSLDVLGPSLVAGFGFGLCLGPVVSAATQGASDAEAGVASAILNASRQIGAAIGLAVVGTAAAAGATSPEDLPSLARGFSLGMAICAGFCLGGSILALLVIPRVAPAHPEGPDAAARPPAPPLPDLQPADPTSAEPTRSERTHDR